MGSWSSGNHHRQRRSTTDELPCIHISDVINRPSLLDGWQYIPFFELPEMRVRCRGDVATLGVVVGNEVTPVARFGLVHSPRNYGGTQTYFQCECGKRVTALYIDNSHIACRHCHALVYDSQFNRKHEQPAAKAAKLRAKLGGGPALWKPLLDKPKYMHWETYHSICYGILAYEAEAAEQLKKYQEERWLPILYKMDELVAQQ